MTIMEMLEQLKQLEAQLKAMQKMVKQTSKSNRETLYEAAKVAIGEKLVKDKEKELGCVLAVREVFKRAFNKELFDTASTFELYQFLLKSKEWKKVADHELGDVIISPT